jgi:hypothetical protein
MAELLRANILADFSFYRRSRLLLAFMLVFLLMAGMESLPPLFAHSGVQSFNALRGIFDDLNGYLLFLAAGLGLFIISAHLRNRSLKMVFTKPCTPAVWLLSAFSTAVMVALLLNLVVLGTAMFMSIVWRIPVRPGLIFISAETFFSCIGLIAYLMLLATIMHPAIAATFALIFNAGTFYSAELWTRSLVRSGNSNPVLWFLQWLFHSLYILLPMIHPFANKTENIEASLRVAHGEWKYLMYSLGYALSLSAFCYSSALLALQRKKHI